MQSNKHHSKKVAPRLSIVVPILNELEVLPDLLAHLQIWQRKGCELLLVDGGSTDESAEVAEAIGFTVIKSERGRSCQMNAGAHSASGDIFLFLHADTRLPEGADQLIMKALANPFRQWGRFDVYISGDPIMLRVVAWFMNMRSRLSGIATGDQAIFIRKSIFNELGGFPSQPLMEDIEFSKRLKQKTRPACLHAKVTTSGRRWISRGVWPTILLMWRLRWAYWRGASAEQLAEQYQ